MLGAIVGDVVGAPYERRGIDPIEGFPLFGASPCFTDDTVLTCVVAAAILDENYDFDASVRTAAEHYPDSGYGGMFNQWIRGELDDYSSYGNGGAMRVSPVGWMTPSRSPGERRNQPTLTRRA